MDELEVAVDFYKNQVEGSTYTIKSDNKLELWFSVQKDELCHLFFGTIDISIYQNPGVFKGINGYNHITSDYSTLNALPYRVRKKGRDRIVAFPQLDWLLQKPKGIHFNKNIIVKGKIIHLEKSVLDADYLLYRIDDTGLIYHLFLRNINVSGNTKLVPVSFFAQRDNNYIADQKEFNVLYSEKISP